MFVIRFNNKQISFKSHNLHHAHNEREATKKRILIFATKKPVFCIFIHTSILYIFQYILSFKDRRDDLKEEKQPLAALYHPINIFLS